MGTDLESGSKRGFGDQNPTVVMAIVSIDKKKEGLETKPLRG